jgi:hypothetical protein
LAARYLRDDDPSEVRILLVYCTLTAENIPWLEILESPRRGTSSPQLADDLIASDLEDSAGGGDEEAVTLRDGREQVLLWEPDAEPEGTIADIELASLRRKDIVSRSAHGQQTQRAVRPSSEAVDG